MGCGHGCTEEALLVLGLGKRLWPSLLGLVAGGMKGGWYRLPAVAILDADITTPVELLAVLEPAVGGLGVPCRCLTLQ